MSNGNTSLHVAVGYDTSKNQGFLKKLLEYIPEEKQTLLNVLNSDGSTLLHVAAIAGNTEAAELVTLIEVKKFVGPITSTQNNYADETPEMVFTREHVDLVIKGEKWMKATADSYTITAALIVTIVFAAAITVPGGNNQDTGIPIHNNNIAFTMFAVSDAISLFTAVTSLLLSLTILTTRFYEKDFLYRLPSRLIIGLAALFISTAAMIIAFGATLFLVFGHDNSWILIPIGVLTCLPITLFVTLQLPLIVDLTGATYGPSIFNKRKPDKCLF
uniref:Ankyrin repeat-containing protein ITN1-like n=1 Tax=Tanacetum cinerariifolium TaxID=118510 RepID=A0A699ISZ7_TANCI|nr:ankyrin repeat-containing protein ITN1-like [Tanacetum cinerariifolium]